MATQLWALPSKANQIAAVNTDGYLYRTENFDASTPTWSRIAMELDSVPDGFVVDPFSPGYLGTGSQINGWITTVGDANTSTPGHIYRVTDIFGTPTFTDEKAFSGPSVGRNIAISPSEQGWVLIITHYSSLGTYGIFRHPTTGWVSAEIQIAAYSASGEHKPGIHIFPHTPGKAWASAFNGTETQGILYETLDYGENWHSRSSDPSVDFGNHLGVDFDAPCHDNHNDNILYYSKPVDGQDQLHHSVGNTVTKIAPQYNGVDYGLPAGQGGLSTALTDRQRVLACVQQETTASLETDVQMNGTLSGGVPDGGVFEYEFLNPYRINFNWHDIPAGSYRGVSAIHLETTTNGPVSSIVLAVGGSSPFDNWDEPNQANPVPVATGDNSLQDPTVTTVENETFYAYSPQPPVYIIRFDCNKNGGFCAQPKNNYPGGNFEWYWRIVSINGVPVTDQLLSGVAVSPDAGASWGWAVPPTSSPPYRGGLIAGDGKTLYLWGEAGKMAYSDDFGDTPLDDRRGNINGMGNPSPGLFIGIASATVIDVYESGQDGEAECPWCHGGNDGKNSLNPVSLRKGEKRLEVTDLSVNTPAGPLAFVRKYRQNKQADPDFQSLGLGWTHNHAIRLRITGLAAEVVLGNGTILKLRRQVTQPAHFEGEPGSNTVLDATGSTWTLTAPDGSTYVFANGINSGDTTTYRVASRAWANGETWTYAYATNNTGTLSDHRLVAVDDGYGRGLQFTYVSQDYTDKRLRRVGDQAAEGLGGETPSGCYVEFGYTQAKPTNPVRYVLTSVRDVRGNMWTYDYYGQDAGETDPARFNLLLERRSPTVDTDGDGLPNGSLVLENLDYTLSGGKIASITQNRGSGLLTTQLTFDVPGPLGEQTTTEEVANQQTTHYFSKGVYAGSENPLGHRSEQSPNDQFRLTSQVDANGNQTQLAWSADGKHLNQVTDALSHETAFAYKNDGTLHSSLDDEGHQTIYAYENANVPRQPTLVLATTGGELAINGTMELDSGWQNVGTPALNKRTPHPDSGDYVRYVATDAVNEGIEGNSWDLVAGYVYAIRARVYPVSGVVKMQVSGVTTFDKTTSGVGSWQTLEATYQPSAGATGKKLQFVSSGGAAEFYVDSVSIRKMQGGSPTEDLAENGGMEAEGAWTNVGTPTANERTLGADVGQYARRIVATAAGQGVEETAARNLLASRTYLILARVYPVSGVVRMKVSGTTAFDTITTGVGEWQTLRAVYTPTVDLTGVRLQFLADGGAAQFYVDTVHILDSTLMLRWQEFAYDNKGRTLVEKTVNPADGVAELQQVTRTYYPNTPALAGAGLLHTVTQEDVNNHPENNQTTTYEYDHAGRVIKTRKSSLLGNCEFSYTVYDTAGIVVASACSAADYIVPASVEEARALYHPNDPVKKHNRVTTYQYDALGRQVKITVNDGPDGLRPFAQTTLTFYDALGRVWRTITNHQDHNYNAAGLWVWENGMWKDQAGGTLISHSSDHTENIVTDTAYNDLGAVRLRRDVLGNVTLYGYDDAGRLVKTVQNAATPTYNNNYYSGTSPDPDLSEYPENTSIPDQDIISEQEYDANGNLVKSIDTLGQVSFTVYDALNRPVKTVRSAKGNATIALNPGDAGYNAANDPRSDSYTPSNLPDRDLIERTEYDNMGRVNRTCDVSGNWTLYGYDLLGRQVKVIQNIHNPTYNVTADKDLSHHVAVGFADQDLISQTVYDSAGRIQYTTDIQGNKTWYVYDGMGRQIKTITNCSYGSGTPPPEDSAYRGDLGNPAADIITETVYDANGRVQKTKRVLKTNQAGNDLEWLWTLYGYDTLGRQVKGIQNASNPGYNITTDPDLSGYTPSGNSDEDITSETVYDVLGRVQQTIDTHGNVTFYGYDTVGRRVKVVQNASNTAYDVDGDLDLSGYTPAGGAGSDQDRITSTEYDLAGRVTRLTDATGLVTLNLYDRLGRRVRTISNYQTQGDPAGWVWDENDSRWEDSSGGPIAHTTDADQNLVADTTYNKAGQVVSTRDTRGTTTRFVYDAAGRQQQVKQAADSALETVSYTCYDKASRVLRTIAHWVPAYDETQQPILPDEKDSGGQWVFNPQPDLTYPDQNRVIEYKYDTAGRPIETTDEVRNKTLTTYTKGGNVVSVTDPAGYITRYVYDALRHPIRVIQNYRVDNSQKIVFQSSPDSGNSSIFVMSSDGINLTRLTNPNGWLTDDWPALSPDGNYVSFYRDRQLDGVYIVESDGSNERLLTNSGGYISVWSPDGSKLLIHNGNPSSAIYVINADGSGQTSLTPHGTSPAWSPDGNKIAFYAIAPDGHLEIYTINANGSGIQCLTNKDMLVRGLPTPPAWSPDSSKIVFECYPGYSNTEIYVMNANGSNQLRLTSSGHTPIWSPVGSQIAFVSPGDVYSLGNLCLIHPDGTNQQYLTDSDDVYLRDIVWSPDGSRIGFSRRYKGLWVVNTDGSGSTVLTNHSETILPQWSPGRAAPTRWIWNATANPSQWEDGEGHPILHGDNNDQNVIVQFTYDKSGRKTSMRDPRGHLTTYSHDKLSRRTKLTNPLPEEWTTTYSNLTGGARVVLTDPNGYNTQRDFDRLGRLKTIDYLGETPKLTPDVTFTYDAAGNRASMVEDNGTANVRITGYVYDDVRRLKQVNFDTDGDANVDETVAYQYNLRGQRTKLTLPSSRDVTYAYDQRGRLTSLTDWDSHQAQFVYDHANRLVSTERANGLTSRYHYDTAGRLRQLRHTQGKRTLAHFDYEVDQRGNRTQALEVLAHPATTTDTIYAYNDDNLLYRGIWTDDVVNGFKVTTSVSASLKLMFFGSAATLTVGTGTDHGIFDVYVSGSLWRSFDGYTASNGARDITLSLASEGPHLLEIRNRAEHNLASSGYGLRFKQLVVPDVAYTLHTIEYTYDGLSRLNKARYNPGLNVNAADGDLLRRYQYTYDLAGNRLSESVALNGGAPTVTNRTYNAANQISNAGFVYDANGNLTNDGTNTYIWDRANRLTTMGGLSYTYDGLGNRVSQTTNSIVTRYLLDLQPSLVHVLAATTPSTTTRFVHGPRGTLAHENNAGAWSWMVQDGLGSVRGEVSNSVAVDGIQSFAPYGTAFDTQGTFETPHAFTGEMLDGNDLLYLRARYYSPTLGIFPSLDPVENLNRYQYVSANPTNWTDPTGLQDDGGCMIYWGDPEGYAQCMGYTCPPGWLNTGNFTYQCTPAPSSDTTGGTFTSADAWAIHWAGLSDAETAQYGYHGGTASFLETLAVGFVAGTGAALGGAVIGTALAACPVCTGVGAYLGESFGRRHGNYIWLHAVSGACGPCIQAQALEVGQAAFVSAYGERGFYWGALTGGAAFISPAAAGIGLSIISSGEAYSAAQDIEAKGSNPCNTAQLILGAFGAASSITIARSGHRLTQTRPPATQEQILSILELTQNRRIHGVIGETLKYAGSGNRSSTYVLTPDEALSAGLLWVSREYIELNTQGVFRSKFPDSNGYYHIFRIDEASLMGAHPPNVPHVHLELILSQKGVVNVHENVVNNHIPIR